MALQRTVGNQVVQRLLTSEPTPTAAQAPHAQVPGSSVQRDGSSVAAPAPNAEEVLRRRAIAAARDREAPALATEAYNAARAQIGTTLETLLNSRKTAAIRENLAKQAKDKIKANLEGAGTKQQKDDALKYLDALFGESKGKLTEVLHDYAVKVGEDKTPAGLKTDFENKAKEPFDTAVPDLKTKELKQVAALKTAAAAKVKTALTQKVADVNRDVETAVLAQLNDPNFLKAEIQTKVGTQGEQEIDKRVALDDKLASDTDVATVYTESLVKPMEAAVVNKLGVGRGAWRRSDELNEFRQALKDAARAQAAKDIKSAAASDAGTNTSELKQQYYGMLAEKHAYALAKGSVDDVMRAEATTIVAAVVPDAATKAELKEAGKSAAYPTARVSANVTKDKEKIFKAAKAGAEAKAAELLTKKQPDAIDRARTIVKGSKKTGGPAKDTVRQGELKTGVEQRVTRDDVGKKSITAAIESNSLNSGFAKIGGLIDFAVPNAGEGCQFTVELKIPIPGASIPGGGGYFLFGFMGKAERDKDGSDETLKVASEITFGVGFQTFGLDANFRVGVFTEAQGANTTAALNLVSYGLYRQMRNISTAAAEHFWSEHSAVSSKKSQRSKAEEAELWAAMIEEEAMGEKGYVDIGLLARAGAKVNAKVLEAEGKLAARRARHYSKAVIDKLTTASAKTGNQARFGKGITGAALKEAALKDRASVIDEGELRYIVEVSGEAKAKWFHDQVLTFGLEGKFTRFGGQTQGVEIAAKAALPFGFGDENSELAEWAARVGPGIASGIKNLIGMYQAQSTEDTKKRVGGATTDLATDAFFMAKGGSDKVATSFVNNLQQTNTVNDTIRSWLPKQEAGASEIETGKAIATESTLEVKLGGKIARDDSGAWNDWEIGLEIGQVKKLEVNAANVLGGLKVSGEKSKRLGKLAFGSGGVKGGLMGIEKT